MMPNTSVSPAASRNSSRPNCNPFSDCSITTSMYPLNSRLQQNSGSATALPPVFYWVHDFSAKPLITWLIMRRKNAARKRQGSLHRAFVVEAILVVLDDGGHRLERELAVGALDHVLQIEILDRDVVVAVFEGTAQRLEIGLLHLGLHRVLLGHVALHRDHRRVDQLRGVVGLRAIIGRAQARIFLVIVLDETLVFGVRQIVHPFLRAGNADRVVLLQR